MDDDGEAWDADDNRPLTDGGAADGGRDPRPEEMDGYGGLSIKLRAEWAERDET